jgi:hypothetical protein
MRIQVGEKFMSAIKLIFVGVVTILLSILTPSVAEACSCLPPDLVRTTSDSDHVLIGRIKRKRKQAGTRYFQLEVEGTVKGCYVPGELVILKSPVSGATCGINLMKNKRYVVTGYKSTLNNGNPAISINACGHNYEWGATPAVERDFLLSRYVDCPSQGYQQCADGSLPMSCTVDPCTTYSGSCTSGTCVANYCGGCNREFYDSSGDAVCETEWSVTPP